MPAGLSIERRVGEAVVGSVRRGPVRRQVEDFAEEEPTVSDALCGVSRNEAGRGDTIDVEEDEEIAGRGLGGPVAGGGEGQLVARDHNVAHGAARIGQLPDRVRLHPGDDEFPAGGRSADSGLA